MVFTPAEWVTEWCMSSHGDSQKWVSHSYFTPLSLPALLHLSTSFFIIRLVETRHHWFTANRDLKKTPRDGLPDTRMSRGFFARVCPHTSLGSSCREALFWYAMQIPHVWTRSVTTPTADTRSRRGAIFFLWARRETKTPGLFSTGQLHLAVCVNITRAVPRLSRQQR